MSLFTEMIVYVENPQKLTKKKILGTKKAYQHPKVTLLIYKCQMFFLNTNNKQSEFLI